VPLGNGELLHERLLNGKLVAEAGHLVLEERADGTPPWSRTGSRAGTALQRHEGRPRPWCHQQPTEV